MKKHVRSISRRPEPAAEGFSMDIISVLLTVLAAFSPLLASKLGGSNP